MIYDIQKASLLKRASAFLLDAILLVVLATGIGLVLSGLLNFDSYNQGMMDCQARYESQYGVEFDLTQAEFAALPETRQQAINEAYAQMVKDKDFLYNYNMVINLSLTILSLALLLSYLALEFAVPLIFGNGQTMGKKIFGIGLMKVNGVRVNAVTLFVRALLGKFTFETMIPLLLVLMIFWNAIGIVGPIVIGLILILELVLMVTSKVNATIHDKLAQTIAVDLASQMIFSTEAELIAYKQRCHEEMVRKQSYF